MFILLTSKSKADVHCSIFIQMVTLALSSNSSSRQSLDTIQFTLWNSMSS